MKIDRVFCVLISTIIVFPYICFSYDFPIQGKSADDFSSAYGPRYYNGYDFHEGTDIAAPAYTNVVPILDGIVTQFGDESVIIGKSDVIRTVIPAAFGHRFRKSFGQFRAFNRNNFLKVVGERIGNLVSSTYLLMFFNNVRRRLCHHAKENSNV